MAKAWIVDLWVKDAIVTLPDGTTTKLSATREQKRSMTTLPEHFRSSRWMQGKRWRVTWHEDGPNGPEPRSRSFAEKRPAEEFKAELEDDIRMGRYLDPSAREQKFSEVAEDWLASKQKVKESTLIRYREALDYHLLPKWGTVAIGAITHKSVVKWVAELVEGTAPTNFARKKSGTALSPASIRHLVRVGFGSVIRYAIRTRLISLNPLDGVELPPDDLDEIPELHILDHAVIDELAGAGGERTQRADDRVLLRLLPYCGPRINEALAVQIGDVDLKRRRIAVRRTWTRTKDRKWKLGPPKTWQKREIPVPKFLVDELRALTKGKKKSDWLFSDKRGKPLEYNTWYAQVWVRAAAEVGLPDGFSPHDLRHTAASIAIAAGADVLVVCRMLGHKDTNETLNTYSHLWPDRLDEVMDAMTEHRVQALKRRDSATDDELDQAA